MTHNVINLFPHKTVNPEKLSNNDIQEFLDVLDKSLESFMEMGPWEKYNLYASLISFTHTSLGLIMKREGENTSET